MSIRKLTQIEKADLKTRHKGERDGRIRDRIKAVLLYDLSDEAVRKHLNDYYKINKLAPEGGGSYSKLTLK